MSLKRLVIPLASGALVAVAYFYFPSSESVVNSKVTVELGGRADGGSINASQVISPPLATPAAQERKDLQEAKRQADQYKQEIEQLMTQYNDHLTDREKRDQLKAVIREKMEEYNRNILPLALAEMKQSNVP